jgi:hypothetical protein
MQNFWKEAAVLFTVSIVKEVPIYRDSCLKRSFALLRTKEKILSGLDK